MGWFAWGLRLPTNGFDEREEQLPILHPDALEPANRLE